MPSKWNPDSGRTSGKSNPRRRSPQGNAWGQQRQQMGQQQAMQGALGNAMPQRPMGPPPGMASIQPPGGPMGPPPMGGGVGMGGPNDAMQRMAVQRAAGVFDKPGMNAPPPMPQFQRPDMSQFQRPPAVGLPPGGIGPPPGGIPPLYGGGIPPKPAMPPGGFGGGNLDQIPAGKMMPNFGAQLGAARGAAGQMGSIQPPQMGGPVADNQMGMQRRAAGLAGGMRPGMM